MRAERPWGSGLSFVLAVALLASGCASLPTGPGQAGRGAVLALSPLSVPSHAARSAATGVYQGEGAGSADGTPEPAPMGLRRGLQGMVVDREGAAGSNREGGAFVCGDKALPSGWPHLDSSREVLEPFLACASPAEFVAMQRGVDMAALVQSLTAWDAVRLGALGPMDAPASAVLSSKRAAFLVTSVEKYGVPYSEVLALFVLHTAFDDELREVVQRLARDKQLGETLGAMAAVREELKRRGLELEGFPERAEKAGDVLRGLGRAGRDMLSSTLVSGEARYTELMAMRGQMPPPYQAAIDEVEKALMERHYSPGSVSAGAFDSLTFGVPVGFYHLAVGTGHGAYSLAQGKYEQATRELAPAALVVAVYAGGKGARALVESRGGLRRLQMPALDAAGMKALMARLEEQFGINAARDLLRYLQASREGALVAAEWGEAGLLALYEARGNPAKAQAVLAEASRESGRGPAVRGGATRSGAGGSSPRGTPSVDVPIRNAHLAGKKHPVTGVPFDMEGYPDFRAAGVVKAEVKIAYTGSRAGDFAAANRAAGLQATPKGMTWHHHQDRTTMQLVPTDVHARTGHTGGFAGGQ
ncbi:HNH endonuclease [Myxococcus qinghaiensis]|uniref:HNH endonuclease n=1 Tax=Myxococcus qinghaiensis TaxID=2906758 RepID=UPI002B1F1D9C|nr:HNH endonuclease [Myxococcus qinghaiensis]